jgi:hypothetical protein
MRTSFLENSLGKNLVRKNALELLTPNRLDLAIKLAFLSADLDEDFFAFDLYRSHLELFGFGEIREPGSPMKNSIEAFVQSFESIWLDVQQDKFDFGISPIPISEGGAIVNGSHRVAASIFEKKDVLTVDSSEGDHVYDAKFFRDRGMSVKLIDFSVLTYLTYAKNPRVALIWPKGNAFGLNENHYFSNIIYSKIINVTPQLVEELVFNAYSNEEWLGQRKDIAPGFAQKASLVAHPDKKMKIVFFEDKGDVDIIQQKETFRAASTKNKHSVHITDDKVETLCLAQMLLNKNTLEFHKNRRFKTTPNFDNLIEQLRKQKADQDDLIVVGSAPLAAYGLRDCSDLDYLSAKNIGEIDHAMIKSHADNSLWYNAGVKRLVSDPENYFYFKGVKLASIDVTYQMKKNRLEAKDRRDLKLMSELEFSRGLKYNDALRILKFKLYFLSMRLFLRLKPLVFLALQKLYLYEAVRKVYRLLLKK